MLKGILKKLLSHLLTLGVARTSMTSYQRRHMLVPILNLHKISFEKSSYWPAIEPDIFSELLSELNKSHRFVGLMDLENLDEWKKPPVVLSFDDGYHDFIDHAMPIIKKFGIRVNQNIIPGCVESQDPPWTVLMYDYLEQATESELKEIAIPNFTYKYNGNKAKLGLELSRFLKKLSIFERKKSLESFWPRVLNTPTHLRSKMLNLDEVRQLSTQCDIGAHSYSHESMGLESLEYFLEDVEKCKNYFKNKLSTTMSIYSFPNGSYRQEHLDELSKSSDLKMLLVENKLANINAKALPRLSIYGGNSQEVLYRSLGYGHWGLA